MKRVTGKAINWEIFFMDIDAVPPPPAVPLLLHCYALRCTIRGLYLLRKKGWGVASQYLRTLRPGRGANEHTTLPVPVALRLAWRNVLPSQVLAHLFGSNARCLVRSYALALYLSAIGLPVTLMVAREKLTIHAQYNFHAWSDLYGTVLNDSSEVPRGYTVLQRIVCQRLVER
ncbi:hypothetical protein KSF_007880 [Reticulibacter mediterranei]|uniref:Microcin J25-processing protein McjB C-terminal domain-containing protein n=1 Tax=Reticulibacter mediterranei TaxID=2778369 RepID=A0A8J3IE17_9CHLR|nr:lasso peptide biosynthesis protein [Reticulibacter mediterranei]GHO90740.1 hypothetical protein KSF_007880 [Reticulibacter mediterranei]